MKFLITAGSTVEAIDQVRVLTNRSSGKLGVALAKEILKEGHELEVIHGPLSVEPPEGGKWYQVESALDMLSALKKRISQNDILIMAAAVCDFRPKAPHLGKKPKKEFDSISLIANPDLLEELKGCEGAPFRIGFSLGENLDKKIPMEKLSKKGLDWIVVNKLESMGSDTGSWKVLNKKSQIVFEQKQTSKSKFAESLVQYCLKRTY